MSFKSSAYWLTALLGTAFISPLQAAEPKLTLPSGANLGVEVIENLRFDSQHARHNDILLHPAQVDGSSHELPEYCLMVATAQLSGERIRITTQDATCIETEGSESAIYSGTFAASAYAMDGQYGIECPSGNCELSPGEAFLLTLDENVSIDAQDNPSAEINATRRQANADGVANPIPSERPDPDQAPTGNQ